jgi:stage III sporulation protein AB
MLKTAGSLLIILASTGIGFRLGNDMVQRIAELREIKKTILMLRGEIKYSGTNLPEAFFNIGRRMEGALKEFLLQVGQELKKMEGRSFQDIWKEKTEECLKDTRLKKQDIDLLKGLGENLGYLDKEMQIGTIDLYIEQLEGEIQNLTENVQTKTRLYRCLGIMGGLFITILII